jgi:predicted permease
MHLALPASAHKDDHDEEQEQEAFGNTDDAERARSLADVVAHASNSAAAPQIIHVSSRHHGRKGEASKGPIWPLVKVTASSIAEVAILSSVGYYLARRGIIDKVTQTKLNKINVSFFTPALLFSKVAFTLNPARLAELVVVPIGFVVVSIVSALVAYGMARIARISRAQRNFAIACAMSPNSNSLPVALMQSLVATVPQLHWEEEGEPEDTVDGMLGRALTYLVLFSTLGMLTRWSIGAKLLATVDEEEESQAQDEGAASTAQLVDVESDNAAQQPPRIAIRRATNDVDASEASPLLSSRRDKPKPRPQAWTRSFPHTDVTAPPSEAGSDSNEDEEAVARRHFNSSSALWNSPAADNAKSFGKRWIVRPYKAFMAFMVRLLLVLAVSPFHLDADANVPTRRHRSGRQSSPSSSP